MRAGKGANSSATTFSARTAGALAALACALALTWLSTSALVAEAATGSDGSDDALAVAPTVGAQASKAAKAAAGAQVPAKVKARSKAKAKVKKVAAPKCPSIRVKANGGSKIKLVVSQKGKVAGFQVKCRRTSGEVRTKTFKKKTIVFKRAKINHNYKFKVRSYRLNAKGKRVYSKFSKAVKVFNGVDPLETSEITKVYHSSFVHGDKPREHQKYIVLHDTEAYTGPESIVSGWTYDNSGTVAAHFVVGRDGRVVQTAPTGKILHHAGWGGPGNFDEKFGVGDNDGEGSGDDMYGTRYLYGYTSYGMNSHSIGIEMCHVAGQDYPDEQLEAIDRLIARIDLYYGGYAGKIIDHKTWRPSNSDTEPAFADYLENYKKYRRHEK